MTQAIAPIHPAGIKVLLGLLVTMPKPTLDKKPKTNPSNICILSSQNNFNQNLTNDHTTTN